MATELVDSLIPAFRRLEKGVCARDFVCVTGPPSVGKTTIVKHIFELKRDYIHAFVNCFNISTPSELYLTICHEFDSKLPNRRKNDVDSIKMMTGACFLERFEEYYQAARKKNIRKLFVVLDQMEVFRKTPLMDSLSTLATVANLNLIMITNEQPCDIIHDFMNISHNCGLRMQDRIYVVLVGCWSKDDIIKTIQKSKPRDNPELYNKFVNNVVNLLYSSYSKDLKLIKLFCQDNYQDFLNEYNKKVLDSLKKLTRNEDPDDLEDETYTVSHGYTTNIITSFLKSFRTTLRNEDLDNWQSTDVDSKLPANSSALIVAAYIAAYTKPSDDKRNFVRRQKRHRQRENSESKTTGSKMFTLERLIQVYKGVISLAIGEQNIHNIYNSDFVLSDVERLESLNIIKIKSGDGISSDTRYKISNRIKRKYVDALAKHIDFSLEYVYGLD